MHIGHVVSIYIIGNSWSFFSPFIFLHFVVNEKKTIWLTSIIWSNQLMIQYPYQSYLYVS